MQVLAQQAVGALRCLAAHPVLTFGGGCLEAWLIAQLVSSEVILYSSFYMRRFARHIVLLS